MADVGEVTYEELTIVQAGRHHGWPWREGRHGWPVDKCRTSTPDTGDCVEPVYECRHGSAAADIDGGCGAITGGAFLTGPRWPEALRDRYVFGDSVTQDIWSVQLTPDRRSVVPGSRRRITHTAGAPVSFRVGPDGDLFVAILPGQNPPPLPGRLPPVNEPASEPEATGGSPHAHRSCFTPSRSMALPSPRRTNSPRSMTR